MPKKRKNLRDAFSQLIIQTCNEQVAAKLADVDSIIDLRVKAALPDLLQNALGELLQASYNGHKPTKRKSGDGPPECKIHKEVMVRRGRLGYLCETCNPRKKAEATS